MRKKIGLTLMILLVMTICGAGGLLVVDSMQDGADESKNNIEQNSTDYIKKKMNHRRPLCILFPRHRC